MKTKPAKRPRTFTEYTYTNGLSEFMAHVCSETSEIFAIYTYADTAERWSDENEDSVTGKPLRPFVWHEGRNPGFRHLKGRAAIRRFVAEFIESGELICTERENEE